MPGTRYTLEVQPHIPQRLNGLIELSELVTHVQDNVPKASAETIVL